LRSADFFDVEKYPEITFASSRVENTKDGLVVHGTITMHGVSKEIAVPFNLNGPITDPWGNQRFGAEAYFTIDRKDFGITWNKVLDTGGLTVSNEVKVEIQIAAVMAK
jgi:polyisoprenoid-binding protein YceI